MSSKYGKTVGVLLASIAVLALASVVATPAYSQDPQVKEKLAALKKEIAQLASTPMPATLVVIVNPSPLALNSAFSNLVRILEENTIPDLTLVAFYEQISIDDPPPFDREIIASRSPGTDSRPTLPSGIPKECRGTDYQVSKCEKQQLSAFGAYKTALEGWKADVLGKNRAWADRLIAKLNDPVLRKTTEGKPGTKWNLRAALDKAGAILQVEPNPKKCLVMLGGLATLDPPVNGPIKRLKNTQLIAAGWRGTDGVQQKWKAALNKVHSTIVFLPVEVTDISLTNYVRTCIGG